jgi:NDP-sugar pyrophosphorylase family protein
VNILIPMAGDGRRFVEAGYTDPKPLIDCGGRTMVQRVVDMLPAGDLVLCVRSTVTPVLDRDYKTVVVNEPTEGAACTALLAAEHIDNNEPLLIVNCDQLVTWDSDRFVSIPYADGAIAVFDEPAQHPKWSYVACGDGGWVSRVAEKDPISTLATCGIYWWSKGSDFCAYARRMIDRDERVNGEFYIAPVYQQAIDDGWNVAAFRVSEMRGLGTPEDYELAREECGW